MYSKILGCIMYLAGVILIYILYYNSLNILNIVFYNLNIAAKHFKCPTEINFF